MKRHFLTYRRALEKYPDCYIDIKDLPVGKDFPNYESVPVATYPAIWVWPDKASSIGDDTGANCIEIYWLLIED